MAFNSTQLEDPLANSPSAMILNNLHANGPPVLQQADLSAVDDLSMPASVDVGDVKEDSALAHQAMEQDRKRMTPSLPYASQAVPQMVRAKRNSIK